MNILCAVDIETTGLDPLRDEILQLAIVPLNLRSSQVLPDDVCEVRRPLNIRIKALMPERMSAEVRKITGLDPCEGLDLLDARQAVKEWFWARYKISFTFAGIDFGLIIMVRRRSISEDM